MKSTLTALAPGLLLAACAFPQATVPQSIERLPSASSEAAAGDGTALASTQEPPRLSVTNAPAPELKTSTVPAGQASSTGPGAPERVAVNLEQMTIKAFAQFVFGNLLKKAVTLDSRIDQRNDLITLRTDDPQTPRQIAETAKLLLQAYGVSVTEFDSLVRVTPADSRTTELPLLRRGRASADTPTALRPVFHLVELEATRSTEMIGWMKTMFGARVEFQDAPSQNAILVSGVPENVTAALEIVRALDQPRMRGRIAKRINPGYLTAVELAARLNEVLTAQGYAVASQASSGPGAAVMLVPVATLNTLFLFTATQAVADHVVRWAAEIDQAPPSAAVNSLFTFPVRFSDAQSLAKTMSELMAAAAAPTAPTAGQPAATVARAPTRVVVNAASNSIIIQGGTPEDHRQWRGLLAELDKPVRSALIDVVVAEVTLGAKEQLGFEWSAANRQVNNGTVSGGTLGGLGLGTGGLTLSFLNSAADISAVLNFLGSSSDARVLSSPKLLTRNAETATIQVGQEVPIVTSQQGNTTGPTLPVTGVLQTIQYRSTGVILRVKPVILAGGRLDLDVVQEVSSATETRTGVTTSPTFSTRRVETKLSLRDGGTVMLGGLISNNSSNGNTGIPYLKDIPGLGVLFRAENKSMDRTELILLITAHVLNDDFESEAITDSFRKSLTPWLSSTPLSGPRLPTAEPIPAALSEPPPAPVAAPLILAPSEPAARPAPLIVPLSTPLQPDPEVIEAPRSAGQRPASGSGAAAPATGAAPAIAQPKRQPDQAAPTGVLQGTPVTDPKLLEELNRAFKK